MITSDYSQTNKSNPNGKFSFWRMVIKHSTVSVLLVSLLALTVVFIWKESQNERQKSVISKAATLQLETNQQELLKIILKPLVWNIR